MIGHDLEEMEKAFTEWRDQIGEVKLIALLSPDDREIDLMHRLFPDSDIHQFSHSFWDLNERCPNKYTEYDIVVTANTMLCSPDVDLWFKHIFEVGKNFWFQDLIRGWRNGDQELSIETGDIKRFCKLPEHEARVENAYDLSSLGDRLKGFQTYKGNSGYRKHDNREMDSLKFVAWVTRPTVAKVEDQQSPAPSKKKR